MNRRSTCAAAVALVLGGLIVLGAPAATAAHTAAGSLELTFVGWHVPDPASPAGFSHTGTFTASGAFCASGRMKTLETRGTTANDTTVVRLLECDDGSGTTTAVVYPVGYEHGGSGNWQLVGGSGAYEKLRGRGRFTSVATGGDPSNEFTITFRSTWSGMADLDDVPPAIAISSATAAKLRRPNGAFSVKLALALDDNVEGNAVSYTLRVTTSSGIELARRFGTARTGAVSATIRVRPPNARTRSILLHLTASDPVGNERKLTRAVKLQR